jgi:rhamnose transport system substrate-binding protein
MRDSRWGRFLALLFAVVLGAAVVTGCGSTKDDSDKGSGGSAASSDTKADAGAAIKKGLNVVVMPKQLGNPYEELEDKGTVAAIEETGGTAKIQGPTDASASSQVSLLRSITQQKPDAIVLAANDPNAIAPVLKQAMQKGVKVVTQDSDAAKDARQIFINQATTESIGVQLAKQAKETAGAEGGEVAVLSATANAPNQNAWIKIMQDELKKPGYENVKVVKVAYGDDDDQKSFQQAQGLLRAYPKLKSIVSPTTVGIAAAARYVSSKPAYKGKVAVTGLGTPNQMRKFVKDGTVQQFALWNPEDVGYLGGYAAAALASGQITGKEGETFKAGKLGDKTIGADGEIVLGPPTTFTKDNIDDFDF